MTGRKGHPVDLGGIPGGHYMAAAVGIGLQLSSDLRQLVDRASVRSRPAAPLMPVNRPQLPLRISPLIPDGDAVLVEVADIGIACDKPEQLVDNGLQVDFFGRKQRKTRRKVEAHLITEYAPGTYARTVFFRSTVSQDMPQQIEILFHNWQNYEECAIFR